MKDKKEMLKIGDKKGKTLAVIWHQFLRSLNSVLANTPLPGKQNGLSEC